jgi:hypothetical protein
MSRQWKPGDVAVWDNGDGRPEVVYRFREYVSSLEEGDLLWQTPDSGEGRPEDRHLRPLVVIDPEDREQVERLLVAQVGTTSGCPDVLMVSEQQVDRTQAALRSLVAPLKPDEPTGLGAVVEDADLLRWVRIEPRIPGNSASVLAWRAREVGKVPRECSWPKVNAVRVLSPGVDA